MQADLPRLHTPDAQAEAATPSWARELLDLVRQVVELLRADRERSPVPSGDPLLDMHQLRELLALSDTTLERLRSRGELPPAIRVGGSLRWRRDIVEKWLAERTEQSEGRRRGKR